MTVLAVSTAEWVALGLATAFISALVLLLVVPVYLAVIEGDAPEADVARFVALTEEARRLMSSAPAPDGDQAAATAAVLGGFVAKKDEARRALWASRDTQRAVASRAARQAAPSSGSRAVPSIPAERALLDR
jgi:hypothetical protein